MMCGRSPFRFGPSSPLACWGRMMPSFFQVERSLDEYIEKPLKLLSVVDVLVQGSLHLEKRRHHPAPGGEILGRVHREAVEVIVGGRAEEAFPVHIEGVADPDDAAAVRVDGFAVS